MIKAQVLVSIVSMMRAGIQSAWFPGCCFRAPDLLINDALAIGYDGVQYLPLRGGDGLEPDSRRPHIKLFENAWNPVWSFWQALRHKPGWSGEPSQLHDWVVSPNPEKCSDIVRRLENRCIPEIKHRFTKGGNSLVEIHPELGMNRTEVLAASLQFEKKLVLDTYHLRRLAKDGQPSPLGSNWKRNVRELAQRIEVIHVHPGEDPRELDQFLKDPLSTQTGETLAYAIEQIYQADGWITHIVAEHQPALLRGSKERAERMHGAIRKFIK